MPFHSSQGLSHRHSSFYSIWTSICVTGHDEREIRSSDTRHLGCSPCGILTTRASTASQEEDWLEPYAFEAIWGLWLCCKWRHISNYCQDWAGKQGTHVCGPTQQFSFRTAQQVQDKESVLHLANKWKGYLRLWFPHFSLRLDIRVNNHRFRGLARGIGYRYLWFTLVFNHIYHIRLLSFTCLLWRVQTIKP